MELRGSSPCNRVAPGPGPGSGSSYVSVLAGASVRTTAWLHLLSSLALATCLAAWGCGTHDDATDAPASEPAVPHATGTPVALPPAQDTPRPGPVRRPPSSPSPDPLAPEESPSRAGRYFAHARFSLARDEQGRPLGVRADSVLVNGRVYWAGVQEQDLLTRINNVILNDPRTFAQAVRMAENEFLAGRPQRIHIIRNGKASALVPMGAIKSEPVPEEQEPEQP
jgi:hypothetical protein